MTKVPERMRRQVRERAQGLCEYCLAPDDSMLFPHEPDHIIAENHSGKTELSNLALACFICNRFKGPNLASIDPQTGKVTNLFNPRTQQWNRHFRLDEPRIEPLTASGRATASLLQFNSPKNLADRLRRMNAGK